MERFFKNLESQSRVMSKSLSIFMIIYSVCSIIIWNMMTGYISDVGNLREKVEATQQTNEKIYEMLLDIRTKQENIDQKQEKVIQEHATSVSYIKATGYSVNSDLSNKNVVLTTKDMDKIIDYWISRNGVDSTFSGQGAVFIKASKESGLNPIYIFAHAAIESAWGSSYIARTKHNYFGINCVDSNPDEGYIMGSCLQEGISSGANWISKNYYQQGYITLQSMKSAGYATDPNWAYAITSVMNSSVQAL